MALIIYPTENADSFISVNDAKTVIDTYTLDGAAWGAKTTAEKEILLRVAYIDIVQHTDPTTYPDPLPDCVPQAQALMAVHDVVNSISGGSVNEIVSNGAIKSQVAGPIKREFYDTKDVSTKTVSRIPAQAQACLSELGYIMARMGQTTLGRS